MLSLKPSPFRKKKKKNRGREEQIGKMTEPMIQTHYRGIQWADYTFDLFIQISYSSLASTDSLNKCSSWLTWQYKYAIVLFSFTFQQGERERERERERNKHKLTQRRRKSLQPKIKSQNKFEWKYWYCCDPRGEFCEAILPIGFLSDNIKFYDVLFGRSTFSTYFLSTWKLVALGGRMQCLCQ